MKQKLIVFGIYSLLIVGFAKLTWPKSPPPAEPPTKPVVVTPKDGKSPGVVDFQNGMAANPQPPKQSDIAQTVPPTLPPVKNTERYVVINNKTYPLRTYEPMLTTNDPSGAQWWVSNAKLDQAWNTPRGSRATTLAVIDTGFALNHEEFTNRWYKNPGETGSSAQENASSLNCSDRHLPLSASCNLIDDNYDGVVDNESGSATYQNPSRLNCTAQGKPITKSCNRKDDDGNGYIDDVTGWDFINNDNSPQAGELNPNGTGTTHGTEVAGVAAATGNNGKGIAGADWGTTILPIQALNDDSYGDTLSVGRAILYAAAQHADVISISLGSTQPDPFVEEAVQTAIASGSVVVAAAGNSGCNCMVYPANYPEVVGVGALDSTSHRASFSSWGDNLDVLAPGTSITAPTWSVASPTSNYAGNLAGTSFSTPLVSGLLTRLLSYQSSETPLQLIAAMTENTNRLGLPVNTPHDTQLGFGSVDGLKATARITTPHSSSIEYMLQPISKGEHFNAETVGSYGIYQCEAGSTPSTAIYQLTKGDIFFSAGWSEIQQAIAGGYSSQFFTYACLQQPQDTPAEIRNINIYSEFLNGQVSR